MSWSPLLPKAKTGAKLAAVAVASWGETARSPRILAITIRRAALPLLGGFLARGSRVDVMFGGGEHSGMLRIVPGPGFMVGTWSGKASVADVARILVPWPPGISPGAHDAIAVEHDYGDGWLELTLPGHAGLVQRPATDIVKPASAAPRAGIVDRVPDPAAELRGRAGR